MTGSLVEDEYGYQWLVTAEMPEAQSVTVSLARRGFRWVVLPRYLLLGLPPEALPKYRTDLASAALGRLIRLRQCMFASR